MRSGEARHKKNISNSSSNNLIDGRMDDSELLLPPPLDVGLMLPLILFVTLSYGSCTKLLLCRRCLPACMRPMPVSRATIQVSARPPLGTVVFYLLFGIGSAMAIDRRGSAAAAVAAASSPQSTSNNSCIVARTATVEDDRIG